MLPDLFHDDVFHIETQRLWLRWPRAADAGALYRIASLAEVAEWTATWPHPIERAEVDRRILRMREGNASGRGLALAITRKKEPGQLVGTLGLHEEAGGVTLGLGFMLDPTWHSRGIMTEAVGGLIDAFLALAPYAAVRGSCLPDNAASHRVFEKTGFSLVGEAMHDAPARGGPQLCLDFELSRAAWRQRRVDRRPSAPRREREACSA